MKGKSPWLPELYVRTENTTWHERGREIEFRVMKNGQEIKRFSCLPVEAKAIVALLKACDVVVDEMERGVPEIPWFKRGSRQ